MYDLIIILYLLMLTNLALTGVLLRRTFRVRPPARRLPSLEWEDARRNFKPIVHVRNATKPTAKVSTRIYGTTLTYWTQKGVPDGVPFVAMYFKDSGIFDGLYVPGDSYLIPDANRVHPAVLFEEVFEQANVAIPIPLGKPFSPTTNNGMVTDGTPVPVLNDEEADALAREYELGSP